MEVHDGDIEGLTRNEVVARFGKPKSWPRGKSNKIPREKAGYFEYEGFRIWFGFGRKDKASWVEILPDQGSKTLTGNCDENTV